MFLIRTLFLAANLCSLINSASGHLIKPRITLHNGHISLYDELLQRDLRGSITPGMPYSLDITLVETHRFDYLIQQCLYNGRSRFIDNSGCFSGDGIFIKKWETTQYNIPRAVKRTIVHFVPQEPVIYIECLVKIIECCGCAEQACERRPLLSMFNQYKETLVLSTRTSGVGVGIPGNQDLVGPGSGQRNTSSGIPWWVWLLLGLLLLLLLLLLFCAICFWCKKCGKTKKEGAVVQKPLPPAPTVPIKTPSEAPTLACDELSASVSRAESALIATVQDPVDYHIHMDRRRAQRREEDGLRNKLEQHLHTHNRFPTVDGRSYLGSQIRSHLAQHNQDFPTSVNGETFRGETEQIMRQSPIII